MNKEIVPAIVDCACVIHGNTYAWTYVERLYNMLSRHVSANIRLHVYTEAERPVPAPMIKHILPNWGISGPKRSWWYKMQLFDPSHHAGPLLYFDLDTVIVNNIDWIYTQPLRYFWAIRDFKYLWRPNYQSANSSIMWWDTCRFEHVWEEFKQQNLDQVLKKYRGDQDYITQAVNDQLRFLDSDRIKSWRWECFDGGYNFKRRSYLATDTPATISKNTDVLVFHGQPKPIDITDPLIIQHWK